VQMLLEYTQLECGCCGNPLAQYFNNYSALLIKTNWLTEVWEHLHTCKVTDEVDGLWQPEANIEQDTVIMETLIASGRFTNKELKDINYCCMYLQALFISYIMNLEGNKIKEWAGRGQTQVGHQSTWEWPFQQRPITWKAWKTALEYIVVGRSRAADEFGFEVCVTVRHHLNAIFFPPLSPPKRTIIMLSSNNVNEDGG
jgi:hypothetical protein